MKFLMQHPRYYTHAPAKYKFWISDRYRNLKQIEALKYQSKIILAVENE